MGDKLFCYNIAWKLPARIKFKSVGYIRIGILSLVHADTMAYLPFKKEKGFMFKKIKVFLNIPINKNIKISSKIM